jgi:PAS domain S-box-containing protein
VEFSQTLQIFEGDPAVLVTRPELFEDSFRRDAATSRLAPTPPEVELHYLRSITDAIRQFIVVLAPDGTTLYVNRAARECTGFAMGALHDKGFFFLVCHPDDLGRLQAKRQEGLLLETPFELEMRVLSKRGYYRWHLTRFNPVKDERGHLAHWYATATDIDDQKRTEDRLEQLRERNASLEKRHKETEAELLLAARVLQPLAPQSLLWHDLAIEAYLSPAHTIGGDFGIVQSQGDEFLNLAVCDVSGPGIASAVMANRMYSETVHALEKGAAPSAVLRQLHDSVLAVGDFYFTMAVARFSRRGRHLSFAAGGHPPAMLLSHGVSRRLDSQNGILGCLSQIAQSESADEIELAKGDRLIFYSDGLIEVFNSRDEMLGIEGLQALLLESASLPIQELKQTILDGVTAWSHGPLTDDACLLIVEVR